MFSYDDWVKPWFTIWIRPRETIRHLVDSEPKYSVFLLAILLGFEVLLGFTSSNYYADRMPLLEMIIYIILWAPLYGLFHWFIYAILLFKVGQWLGGVGTFSELRTTVAWSAMPLFWGMLLWVPTIIILGEGAFSVNLPSIGSIAMVILIVVWILKQAFLIWYLVVFVVGIADVHEVSIWKSLLIIFVSTIGWILALIVAMFIV